MAHTFTNLLVHVIFSTKDRLPQIDPDLSPRLFPYMGGILRECDTTPLLINGVSDHVHLLIGLSATRSLAAITPRSLADALKANSTPSG